MAKTGPFEFLQQVRAEATKVTWPTRRETAITTAMVFVMVAIASVFFLIADQLMRFVVTLVLQIGVRSPTLKDETERRFLFGSRFAAEVRLPGRRRWLLPTARGHTRQAAPHLRAPPVRLAGVEGLEPPTPGFGDRCSGQLSYTPFQ